MSTYRSLHGYEERMYELLHYDLSISYDNEDVVRDIYIQLETIMIYVNHTSPNPQLPRIPSSIHSLNALKLSPCTVGITVGMQVKSGSCREFLGWCFQKHQFRYS